MSAEGWAEKSRKDLRSFMRVGESRPDGTAYTKPSGKERKAGNRRRGRVSKAARKVNRGR